MYLQVTIGDATSSGSSSSAANHNASARAPSPQAISPLTSIRAVRSQFSTLESAFKFPPVLDFEHSELAASTNNAPVRAYEQALSGLLEQLDAIESDGDEEVREVRRNVVREVERALESVERKVKEKAPQDSVPEVTKEEAVKGYDVESEEAAAEAGPLASQDVPSDDVALVTVSGSVKRISAPVAVSLADADVDQAISGEYQHRYSASPVAVSSDVAVLGLDGGATLAPVADADVGGTSTRDAEAVPAPVDELSGSSDSVATIIPRAPTAPAARPSKITAGVPSAPESETFLESMSHAQFTFPPKPASSQSSRTGFGEAQDDAVLVGDESSGDELGSVRGPAEKTGGLKSTLENVESRSLGMSCDHIFFLFFLFFLTNEVKLLRRITIYVCFITRTSCFFFLSLYSNVTVAWSDYFFNTTNCKSRWQCDFGKQIFVRFRGPFL
ncbi:hypothetical protein BC827DRAFT_880695 [Russula dissimulans]|nr:hypothetical protein BC827DRAFT_880695 [Russula dissimulans]